MDYDITLQKISTKKKNETKLKLYNENARNNFVLLKLNKKF